MARSPKNLKASIQEFEKQLDDDPASAVFFPLANLVWEQGEADRAISLLVAGLENHPDYMAPRVLLGEIFLAKDQVESAASELKKVVEKRPWNLTAQKLLMDCCRREGDEEGVRRALVAIGMFDLGSEAARRVIEQGTPSPLAEEGGSGDEAPLEESLDAVPTLSLAELYVSQGHFDKALEVYQRLQEEEPDNQTYREKISELENRLGKGGAKAAEDLVVETVSNGDAADENLVLDEMDLDILESDEGVPEAGEIEPPAEDEVSIDILVDDEAADVEIEITREEGETADSEISVDILMEKSGTEDGAVDEIESAGGAPEETAEDEVPGPDEEIESGDSVSETLDISPDEEGVPVTEGTLAEGPSPEVGEIIGPEDMSGQREKTGPGERGEAEIPAGEGEMGEHLEEVEKERGPDSREMLEPAELAGEFLRGREESASIPPGEEDLGFVGDLSEGLGLEASGELFADQGLDFTDEIAPVAGSESVLREIVHAYIQEGAFRQALDLCRKAVRVSGNTGWLESQIRFLEEKSEEKGGRDSDESLPEFSENDNKTRASSSAPSSGVVQALEGWLRTIERRKTEMSAGPEGE